MITLRGKGYIKHGFLSHKIQYTVIPTRVTELQFHYQTSYIRIRWCSFKGFLFNRVTERRCLLLRLYSVRDRLINEWSMEPWWRDTDRAQHQYSRKTSCPNASVFTTNPIWNNTGLNSGLHSTRSATNRLSHGLYLKPYHLFIHTVFKRISWTEVT